MLLNNFDAAVHRINKIVIGSGVSDLSEKEVVSKFLPFENVVHPFQDMSVSPVYSLDNETWFPDFPAREVFEDWKRGTHDVIQGIIKFRIEIVPDKNMSIREIGFFADETIFAYKVIKEFVIGKMEEMHRYVFHYRLKCDFATSKNINNICRLCV